jgi:hypothetical protein
MLHIKIAVHVKKPICNKNATIDDKKKKITAYLTQYFINHH